MYVIFPADEVIYLSYDRLIVVPESGQEVPAFARASYSSVEPTTSNNSTLIHTQQSEPGTSKIEYDLVEGQPSSSRGCNQSTQEVKPKKKGLRLNFNLLKRKNSKDSETQGALSSRVRHSVGHREHSGVNAAPSEVFRQFCNISTPSASNSAAVAPREPREPREREKTPSTYNEEKLSSKRSSTSSFSKPPTGRPPVQEDQGGSKRSSKHSSSSSKSLRQGKESPISLANNIKERDKTPTRKISSPSTLNIDQFSPISTSREKNLVEPSPEPRVKSRSNPFKLSFRRSKTPEPSSSQPNRPERKKEKKAAPTPIKPPERKLSFSDYIAVSREKKAQVNSDNGDKLPPRDNKTPVLGLFRKTSSPKNLGRDRTPHLNKEPFLFPAENCSRPASAEPRLISDKRPDASKPKGAPRRKDRV